MATSRGNASYETLQRADKAYADQNWTQAELLYKEIIHTIPQDAYAYFRLGTIFANTNRLGEAVSAYNEAVFRDRQHSKAFYNLGQVYILLARKALEESLAAGAKRTEFGHAAESVLNKLAAVQDSRRSDFPLAASEQKATTTVATSTTSPEIVSSFEKETKVKSNTISSAPTTTSQLETSGSVGTQRMQSDSGSIGSISDVTSSPMAAPSPSTQWTVVYEKPAVGVSGGLSSLPPDHSLTSASNPPAESIVSNAGKWVTNKIPISYEQAPHDLHASSQLRSEAPNSKAHNQEAIDTSEGEMTTASNQAASGHNVIPTVSVTPIMPEKKLETTTVSGALAGSLDPIRAGTRSALIEQPLVTPTPSRTPGWAKTARTIENEATSYSEMHAEHSKSDADQENSGALPSLVVGDSYQVTRGDSALRFRPNAKANALLWLDKADLVTVVSETRAGRWAEVSFAGVTGWMETQWLEPFALQEHK